MAAERALGRVPVEQHHNNPGFDILSMDPATGIVLLHRGQGPPARHARDQGARPARCARQSRTPSASASPSFECLHEPDGAADGQLLRPPVRHATSCTSPRPTSRSTSPTSALRRGAPVTYKKKLIEVALPLADDQRSSRPREVDPPRPPVDAAPVVGATAARRGARRALGIAGRRSVRATRRVPDRGGPADRAQAAVRHPRATRAMGGVERRSRPAEARAEIERCCDGDLPTILDPFGGGGAIPLEALRLGLPTFSGDLNPVAVSDPAGDAWRSRRFAGKPPVAPGCTTGRRDCLGRAHGARRRRRGIRRVDARQRLSGASGTSTRTSICSRWRTATPIAWIWARTVESPDPSWPATCPSLRSWTLAKKPGKPTSGSSRSSTATTQTITLRDSRGRHAAGRRTSVDGDGTCIATGTPMPVSYIRAEAQDGSHGPALMAVVADGPARSEPTCAASEMPQLHATRRCRRAQGPASER